MSGRSNRNIVIICGLVLAVLFLEPLMSLFVGLTDRFAREPALNYVLAKILAIAGFLLSMGVFQNEKMRPIRKMLLVYILAALGMAGIYYLIYSFNVDCYSFSTKGVQPVSLLDFIYFSFVTVMTVGFGDMVPNHSFVRMLVVMQTLFGAFLLIRAARRT